MDYLPIYVDLKGETCLVVGAGPVALGKARVLRKAGATLRIVAPDVTAEMAEFAEDESVTLEERAFEASDLDGIRLVIAATGNPDLNAEITRTARAQGLLANSVTDPEVSSFIMPAIIDRNPVIAAISTSGASPVLARRMRAHLETLLPAGYGHLARLAGEFREEVKARIDTLTQRRAFWDQIFDGKVAELAYAGREAEARSAIREEIDAAAESKKPLGAVYLVGAGPGDPDLLTFRAMRLIGQADVVLYDRLVSAPVLDLIRRDAEKIYVGKRRSDHSVPQPEINERLVDLAKAGNRVVRLKGGDPFIFGRGGEELATLAENGIPFEVVPGITAASGCAAYAGIPLTHRDFAHACMFVPGTLHDGNLVLEWDVLTRPMQTVVIYMGLANLEYIFQILIAHGLPADTPAALIQEGTSDSQRVVVSTAEGLPEAVAKADVRAPTLVIIGHVVTLHRKLAWFEPAGQR